VSNGRQSDGRQSEPARVRSTPLLFCRSHGSLYPSFSAWTVDSSFGGCRIHWPSLQSSTGILCSYRYLLKGFTITFYVATVHAFRREINLLFQVCEDDKDKNGAKLDRVDSTTSNWTSTAGGDNCVRKTRVQWTVTVL
jgi:hypothetical protein